MRAVGVAIDFDASAAWVDCPIAFLDVETTGRDPENDRLVEVGIVIGRGTEILASKGWLINPGRPIPKEITAIHGISDADVAEAPSFAEVAHEILTLLAGAIPAAYNAAFDRGFLLYKHEDSRALGDMATRLGIVLEQAHRATADAEAALRVLYALAKDPRVPRAYGGLIQEQRRLGRIQDEARRLWRKPN